MTEGVREKLLPCPFCGGEASFIENAIDFSTVWGVMCTDDCGAWIDSCEETQAEAAKVWNTRQAPPTGWRPIESAPKDGTWVDLWASCGVRKASMCWRRIDRLNCDGWTDDWYGRGTLFAEQQFTHWMPLPEPPAEGEG